MLLLSTVLLSLQLTTGYQPLHTQRIGNAPLTRANRSKSRRNWLGRQMTGALQVVPAPGNGVIEGFSQAFIGGTTGVMSVMFLLEVQKQKDISMEACPYCMGSGQILCGACLGAGTTLRNSDKCTCSECTGRGQVICINCKGDGRTTPLLLQSRAVRDPEYGAPDDPNSIAIDSP